MKKKAIIDYNFHNYEQSFHQRLQPIVQSALFFIREYVEECGGSVKPDFLLTSQGEVIEIGVTKEEIFVNLNGVKDTIDLLSDGTIIEIAQELWEN
jgi:hypothetical protein